MKKNLMDINYLNYFIYNGLFNKIKFVINIYKYYKYVRIL